jgi:hypothetical protein
MKYFRTGSMVREDTRVAFDFEVRKNLLYVDWNEKMNNWSTESVRDVDVEYYDSIDELEIESDWDTGLNREWERTLVKSEEDADFNIQPYLIIKHNIYLQVWLFK